MNRAERRPTAPSRAEMAARASRRRIAVIASISLLAVVVIVAIALASRVPKPPSETAALSVGQKAPEFAVSTTAGPFDLANAGGKPTLLELFATWCPHCQRETAVMNQIYATYKSHANVVAVAASPYAIDETTPESQADVIAFAQKFNVVYPVAFDPNLDVAKNYLQSGFPTIVLIGASGLVQSMGDGEIPKANLTKALDASLAGKRPDPKLGLK